MLFAHFRIAFKFLVKHKDYTLINTIGLALSLVCVLFIGLFIHDELASDRFHSKADRIYRVIEKERSADGQETNIADVSFRVGSLHEQLPELEGSCRISTFWRSNFSTPENENKVYEQFTVSDQGFFDLFDFELYAGSREKALSEANTAIVTRSMAIRLFGTADVLGKTIIRERDQSFKITAVLEDFPPNSQIQGNMFFSLESFANAEWYRKQLPNDWDGNGFPTYILARENTDRASLEKAINAAVRPNLPKESTMVSIYLQPLTDVHFYSAGIEGGRAVNMGEISYLYIFGAVGLFILLIACINYINLSTSLSITRGKEVGVKKVAGATRLNLIWQFITESNMVSLMALLIALLMVNVMIPSFNAFTGKAISMSLIWSPPVLSAIVIFIFLVGTLSGSYPAFYLSRFKPAQAIKGFSSVQKGLMRQGLVVFQFALAITLILATSVAYQQLSFIRNKNLGFQKEQLVVLDINSGDVRRGFDVIKTELSKISAVKEVSVSSRVPGEWKNLPQVGVSMHGSDVEDKLYFMGADAAFLKTFEIDLIAGRNFSEEILTDSTAFLINETAARMLGIVKPADDPINIGVVNFGTQDGNLDQPFQGRVIGIVKDFHFQSLYQQVGPLIIAWRDNPVHAIDYFTVRLSQNDWSSTLKDVERAFQKVDPAHLIEYNFLDQRLEDFYREDMKRGQLFAVATAVAIALACLGLFSLASFMTEQRTKEIGIRKALGATTAQIVVMLSSNYLKLVVAGFIIATPIAVWALSEWLQSFAYRISIGWVSVLVTCTLSVFIALATVGFKSLRAAMENPVKALRNE
jgi:putative ABC transport system permease protein